MANEKPLIKLKTGTNRGKYKEDKGNTMELEKQMIKTINAQVTGIQKTCVNKFKTTANKTRHKFKSVKPIGVLKNANIFFIIGNFLSETPTKRSKL